MQSFHFPASHVHATHFKNYPIPGEFHNLEENQMETKQTNICPCLVHLRSLNVFASSPEATDQHLFQPMVLPIHWWFYYFPPHSSQKITKCHVKAQARTKSFLRNVPSDTLIVTGYCHCLTYFYCINIRVLQKRIEATVVLLSGRLFNCHVQRRMNSQILSEFQFGLFFHQFCTMRKSMGESCPLK